MSDINVRVIGSANMTAMTAPFGKLEAQVTALNAQLSRMLTLQNGMDPKGYERMASAAAQNSRVFRNAAASTGMFEVQQLRVNKATDDFIGKLQKQKLSFGDMLRQQKLVSAAYRDQLKLQNMVATTSTFGTTHGKTTVDTFTPNVVQRTKGLERFNSQLAYGNMLLKSGATQMINWGKNTQWAGRQLSMGLTMPIVALGAAAGVMAYQMDQAFTQVAKVYNTTAKSGIAQQKELDQVRAAGLQTAMEAAQQYGQAGKDTIGVQAELAATGKKGIELQQATLQVMKISRLGDLDYNDAIKTTIALQSVFNMNSKKLGETFNYINDVENQTSLTTQDFAKAIPIAAAPVKAFGGNIQELGTLLVAMKQNGIEATQGANAIKAAMQRLGRPSKQIQDEWTALTHTDITQIFEKSKNLIDLFSKIGDATKNLAPKDQIKAFAGLFGTYQVTRMMAMVKGMEDLKNGVGQVSEASKLAQQSTAQWAKVAQQEIERYQNSISGKWQRAIEDMKIQLSTLGEPFVVVATDIISALSGVVKAFNKLPDLAKKLIAVPILLTALAGPLLMLIGLVANLAGNGLKAVSLLLPKMGLVTTNQKAAALAAEQTAEAQMVEADSTKLLTHWLLQLAAAQELASKSTLTNRLNALTAAGMTKRAAGFQIRAENEMMASAMSNLSPQVKASAAVAENTGKTAKLAKLGSAAFGASAAAMAVMMVSSNKTVDHIAEMVMYAGLLAPLLIPLGAKLVSTFSSVVKSIATATTAAGGLRLAMGEVAAEMGIATAAGGAIALGVVAAVAGIAGAFYLIHKHQAEVEKKQQEIYAKALAANKALDNTAADFAANLGKAVGSYDTIIKGGRQTIQTATGQQFGNQTYKAYEFFTKDSTGMKDAAGFKNALSDPSSVMDKLKQQYLDFQKISNMTAAQAMHSIEGLLMAVGKSGTDALAIASQIYNELGSIKDMDWSSALANSKKVLDEELASSLAASNTGPHVHAYAGGAGTPSGGYIDWTAVEADNAKGLAAIKGQIDKFAGVFTSAWENAANPAQARNAMNDFMEAAISEFTKEYQKMLQNPILAQLLQQKKITSGAGLEKAFNSGALSYTDISAAMTAAGKNSPDFVDPGKIEAALKFAQLFDASMTSSAVKAGHLDANIKYGNELLGKLVETGKSLTFGQATKQINGITEAVKTATSRLAMQQTLNSHGTNSVGVAQAKNSLAVMKNTAAAQINAMNLARGYAQGSTYAKALYNFMHQVDVETGKAKDGAKGVADSLNAIPRMINITLSKKEMITTVHDAMSAVEGDMVTSAQANFNSGWDATMAAAQAAWDKRQTALQNRQSNQSDALQRRQQNAQDAMDKRFQKAQDDINKRYQKRIDAVNKEIKAEQDADAKRQAMYEAEKKRMQDLADMADKNIDFNSAINQGNFDEAAKIRNDMEAQQGANTLDAIEARRSAKVQKAVDRLQKKIDNLEKLRDKELKRLQNVEDAQKKHLERMQQAQTKALEKSQKAESDALAKSEAADMASQQKKRDFEEAMLNQRLDLFQTYVAKNQKDLERWMRKVGLTYSDFGSDIKAKGESWASYFQKALHDHIIAGASQIKSDKMWDSITPKLAAKLLKGLGFASLGAFQKFVNTGRLKDEQRGGGPGNLDFQHHPQKPKNHHGGGMVGMAPDNRKGLRGAYGGMHPSEQMVRAQKGEYIVNRKAALKHRRALDYINGTGGTKKVGYGGAGVLPIVGYPAAMIAQGFTAGTEAASKIAMKNYKASQKASQTGPGGTTSGYKPGPGGKSRPVPKGIGLTQGLHDVSTGYAALDFAAPLNTPAYAVGNGVITRSEAISGSGTPGNGQYAFPYSSYGNVEYLKLDNGPTVLYAHLNKRMVHAGQRVTGGSRIGLTGNTGNSTGPHLHFGDSDGNPFEFLRKGGTVKFDNTPAMLHRGETVLTDRLTKQFKDNIASGGSSYYDIDVNVDGTDASPNDIAKEVLKVIERRERRGPTKRRNRSN